MTATEKRSSNRLKAICDELWPIKTELLSISHLLGSLDPHNGGDEFVGLSLILDRHVRTLEALIESASSDKP
jgi:hypothetical protein